MSGYGQRFKPEHLGIECGLDTEMMEMRVMGRFM
jgi:hypothetical protein